jgi:hypothetical protein
MFHQTYQVANFTSRREYGLLRAEPNVDQPSAWNQRADSK